MTTHETRVIAEPGKQEFFIERTFDAPRELVFRAFTDPELYVQWLSPMEYSMTLETFEPRDNGAWRYTHTDTNGESYGFHGVYHMVHAPELIINTFEFEGIPEKGHVCLETVRFEELPGEKTRLTSQSVFQSVTDRDLMLSQGMEGGVHSAYEKLAALLEKLVKGK